MKRPRAASPAGSEQGFDISNALTGETEPDGDTSFPGSTSARSVRALDEGQALPESDSDGDDAAFIRAQQAAVNRQAGKNGTSKKSGGFQSMGFNAALLKAITKKGFNVPTPIQRKAVPPILEGEDVVGMARTGSGKTAAFVIPMIEKLKAHSVKVGARAIVMSPSRELALQTLKATKEFGRGTDLRCVLLVGGDSIEDQFSEMSSNPDIIIATPGRFMHLLVEMSLDLSSIRYVVFDEADRLFEMGFQQQLNEILHALPPSRQTLLFSATLPASLVEFAKAGLRDPKLIRLDAEGKISPDLENAFLSLKSSEKEAALLHVLNDVIKMPPAASQQSDGASHSEKAGKKRKREKDPGPNELPTEHSTVVFAATKHHVEYLAQLLKEMGFGVSYVYSSLDQRAREAQVAQFRAGQTTILVCTDVAARGVDIPLLANVINYDFPSQPKLFVHRVGRTARAGRKGWSYSFVQTSDIPYLLDLQLFLGRKLVLGRQGHGSVSFSDDIVMGSVPRPKLDVSAESVTRIVEEDEDISTLKTVATKAEKMYRKSRNAASVESAKRARTVSSDQALQETCLLYEDEITVGDTARDQMLARISGFRPQETIFEIGRRGEAAKTEAARAAEQMRKKRTKGQLKSQLQAVADRQDGDESANGGQGIGSPSNEELEDDRNHVVTTLDDEASDDGLEITFPEPKPWKGGKGQAQAWQDSENFMSYVPTGVNQAEERGYGVSSGSGQNTNFAAAAKGAVMDFGQDDSKGFAEASKPKMRWDKRSKKYVSTANDTDGSKGARTIRGESGQKLAASFKSGRYDQWRRDNKLGRMPRLGEKESSSQARGALPGKRYTHYAERAPKQPDKYRDDYYQKKKKIDEAKSNSTAAGVKSDLRSAEEIRKQRKLKDKRREKTGRHSKKKKV